MPLRAKTLKWISFKMHKSAVMIRNKTPSDLAKVSNYCTLHKPD